MVRQSLPRGTRVEGIHITDNDFVAGRDSGEDLEAGEVGEVARAEVGEDGQLSSYDYLRPGDNTDPQDVTRGRMFMELADDAGDDAEDTLQVRVSMRDKNSNRREPVTRWFTNRDLDRDRPDHRKVLRPVTKGGEPLFIKSGRIISIEVKDDSGVANVDLDESVIELPAMGAF